MLLSFFFIYYIIFIYSNYVYIIFVYTNLPCFVKRPRAIVIDWALYIYIYYYYLYVYNFRHALRQRQSPTQRIYYDTVCVSIWICA